MAGMFGTHVGRLFVAARRFPWHGSDPYVGGAEKSVPIWGHERRIQEFFAGMAGITREWTSRGLEAFTPVELYEDPHNKRGPRAEHDLLDPRVVEMHLQRFRNFEGPNVIVLEPMCASFCDFQLQNGGTRTFENPGGDPVNAKEVEIQGNKAADAAALLFETALDCCMFPILENTAPTGRYPKIWDYGRFPAILARPDVQVTPTEMCAHGKAAFPEAMPSTSHNDESRAT